MAAAGGEAWESGEVTVLILAGAWLVFIIAAPSIMEAEALRKAQKIRETSIIDEPCDNMRIYLGTEASIKMFQMEADLQMQILRHQEQRAASFIDIPRSLGYGVPAAKTSNPLPP